MSQPADPAKNLTARLPLIHDDINPDILESRMISLVRMLERDAEQGELAPDWGTFRVDIQQLDLQSTLSVVQATVDLLP